MSSDPAESRRIDAFFSAVIRAVGGPIEADTIAVTHLLPDRPHFLDALHGLTTLRAVIPKPRSVDHRTLDRVRAMYRCDDIDRSELARPQTLTRYVERVAPAHKLVLLDIGGYFAAGLEALCREHPGRILGVVEDTENGYQRYAALRRLPCPVVTVARSPLKVPEDYLVGQSVVFSTEALLRTRGDILHGRETLVIGYGKIGRSVATTLRLKSVKTTIYETDSSRAVEAMAHGFAVTHDKNRALARAGIVVCATGNRALHGADIPALRKGAYVASVTSSDDELDLRGIDSSYERTQLGDTITRLDARERDHHFYLLNQGNAVNFVHGVSVGPFIFLVQAEILAAAVLLARGVDKVGIAEVDNKQRGVIARLWLRHFNDEGEAL